MPASYPSIPEAAATSTTGDSSNTHAAATSVGELAQSATRGYVHAVRTGDFPSAERGETYDMDEGEWLAFLDLVRADEVFSKLDLEIFVNNKA